MACINVPLISVNCLDSGDVWQHLQTFVDMLKLASNVMNDMSKPVDVDVPVEVESKGRFSALDMRNTPATTAQAMPTSAPKQQDSSDIVYLSFKDIGQWTALGRVFGGVGRRGGCHLLRSCRIPDIP